MLHLKKLREEGKSQSQVIEYVFFSFAVTPAAAATTTACISQHTDPPLAPPSDLMPLTLVFDHNLGRHGLGSGLATNTTA